MELILELISQLEAGVLVAEKGTSKAFVCRVGDYFISVIKARVYLMLSNAVVHLPFWTLVSNTSPASCAVA